MFHLLATAHIDPVCTDLFQPSLADQRQLCYPKVTLLFVTV